MKHLKGRGPTEAVLLEMESWAIREVGSEWLTDLLSAANGIGCKEQLIASQERSRRAGGPGCGLQSIHLDAPSSMPWCPSGTE